MADSKISALTAAASLADTDELVLASAGANKKITGANLKGSVGGSTLYKPGMTFERPTLTGFSAATMPQNTLGAVPFLIMGAVPVTFSAVMVQVSTLLAATTLRMGWYAVGSNGQPGALLYDLGTVDCSTSGIKVISTPFTLGPGWVWYSWLPKGGSPEVRTGVSNFIATDQLAAGNASQFSGAAPGGAISPAFGGTTLPDPFPAVAYNVNGVNATPRFFVTV